MKIVFYDPVAGKSGKKLLNKVQGECPEYTTEICPGIHNFRDTLCRPRQDISIAILQAENQLDLKELISMDDLLENIRVIQVLPDRFPTTLFLGLKMKNSYLTFSDSDFTDVVSVLNKISKNVTINQRRS